MNYTCAYWKNADNLEQAQQDKMDLIAHKLKLKPGMRVLDLGCGWGALCHHLAKNYGVSVVGCTVGSDGAKFGMERSKGLPVDIRVVDYRDMNEKFDRVVSIGLCEHVGRHNYDEFFDVARRCLNDGGLFLMHTIGTNSDEFPRGEAWYDKYIFPNGRLPHATDITKAANRRFVLEDWHNFGPDYTKTLYAWHDKFVNNWPAVKHLFPEPQKFYRLWSFYLMSAAGGFAARKTQLWQVVFSKGGVPGGYQSVR